FHLSEMHFQTGWFIESIATQVLIIFIIRTKRVPFFKSRPSWYVLSSGLGVVALAWAIPYTPIGALFSFVALPPMILLAILVIVAAYLVVGEIVKYFFYRRYAHAP
ncbi:MAG TPA: cation transporting ATPase C-terminal domain-containing protein, partial [Candidatus Paceibacterota bacterium]